MRLITRQGNKTMKKGKPPATPVLKVLPNSAAPSETRKPEDCHLTGRRRFPGGTLPQSQTLETQPWAFQAKIQWFFFDRPKHSYVAREKGFLCKDKRLRTVLCAGKGGGYTCQGMTEKGEDDCLSCQMYI